MSRNALHSTSNVGGLSSHDRELLTAIAKLYLDEPTIMTRKQMIGKMRTPSSRRTVDRALKTLESLGLVRRRRATEPAKMHLVTIEILVSSTTEKHSKSRRPTERQKLAPERRSIERHNGAPYIRSKYTPYTAPAVESVSGIVIDVKQDPELYAECCRWLGKDANCEKLHTPRMTVKASVIEKARAKLNSGRTSSP